MKKFRNIAITFISLIMCLVFNTKVFANSLTYVADIKPAVGTVQKNDNITLTFTGKELDDIAGGLGGVQGTITYDSTYLTYVTSSKSQSEWKLKTNPLSSDTATKQITFLMKDDDAPNNPLNSDSELFTITFTANTVGTTQVSFTVLKGTSENGVSLTASPITKTITITEKQEVIKSSDANLSSLSLSEGSLSPAFDPGTTSYKASVGNDVTSIDVSAITSDGKAKVSISGNKNLSVGKNNIIVEVTAENGNKKAYTIEVTRAAGSGSGSGTGTSTGSTPTPKVDSKSSNANLAAVYGIDNISFDPYTTVYNVTLPFEDSNLDVSAVAASTKAKVNISNGNIKNLEVGKQYTTTITVVAEDGSIKVYTFNVTRSNIKSETGLKELKVNGEDVLKDGEKDIYTIKVPKSTEKVDISAIPTSEGSTVKIKGNTTLKDGTNTIVVEVTDKNGFTKAYTVNVERKTNAIFAFFQKWWPFLLGTVILTGLLAFLIFAYHRNRLLIAAVAKEREEVEEKTVNNIDDRDIIVYNYNSNNNITSDDDTVTSVAADDDISTELVPKHAMSSEEETINNLLNDDLTSEVSKEIKVVREATDELEKEYKIIEKYRKK